MHLNMTAELILSWEVGGGIRSWRLWCGGGGGN